MIVVDEWPKDAFPNEPNKGMIIPPPEQPVTTSRMDLPRPDGFIFVPVFSVILAFFAAVAVFNLANYQELPFYATVLSVLWLLIVAVGVSMGVVEEHGIRRFVMNRFATLSSHHFVEVSPQAAEAITIRFGFRLLRFHFTQFRIPGTKLVSIKWSAGQATGMSGHDMDDWQVTVWYHLKGSRWTESGYGEASFHIVGPSGPRTDATATGHRLVAFLESAGIAFYPTSKECEFSTDDPTTAV